MLSRFRSPFKQQDHDHHQRRSSSSTSTCNNDHKSPNSGNNKHERKVVIKRSSLAQVGLRIVFQISSSQEYPNNVVVKSALRRATRMASKSSGIEYSCFLKTCHLCNKGLRLDKEVYMYRGDQGFCSIECRNRQIFIDEMQELEASTKKMVASYRNSCNPRRQYETCFLLEEPSHSTKRSINRPLVPNHHLPHHNRAVFIL